VAEARYVVEKGLIGDPKAVAEMPAKTGGRELKYLKGEEMQAMAAQVMAQSAKLIPDLKAIQKAAAN
jgi:hypothetical protein